MPRPVEIAVCNVRIFFEADDIEDIIPVGYLPCIDVFGVFLLLFQRKRVSLPDQTVVRMTRDSQGVLLFCFEEYLFVAPACGDEFFYINNQDVG